MLRRTLLTSAVAVSFTPIIGTIPVEAHPIVPQLFVASLWNRLDEKFRNNLFSKIGGRYIGAERNHTTVRRYLDTRYAFDSVKSEDIIIDELCQAIASEFPSIGNPIHLVAVDTEGFRIDPKTLEPVLEFYVDHNPA